MIRPRAGAPLPALVLVVAALVSCSGDDGSGAPTETPVATLASFDCASTPPTLRVDLIDEAIAAVEAERGGAQRYFEINATPLLVNLFVAGDDGATVTPYVYVDGELSSDDAVEAEGNTFTADAVDIDPLRVTSCVAAELAGSAQDAFIVEGGPQGAVRFSVLVTSQAGGQLVVGVDGVGAVLSVDPV